MPRESHVLLTVLSVCLAGLVGCSSGSSGNDPEIIVDPPGLELVVVDVQPSTGAASVDPNAEVTVTFNLPVDELPAAAWVMQHGAATLPGTLEASVDGLTWTWRPDVQMPHGANATLRVASGIRSRDGIQLATVLESAFQVREVITEASYQMPTGPSKVLIWPNGRRAATTGNRCHEVVFGQLVERPFLFQEDDVPYGDGSFVTRVGTPGNGQLWLARRNLDGSEQLIPLPSPWMRLTSVNTSGDAVFAYRQPVVAATPWLLFRLPVGAQVFEWLGTANAPGTSRFEPVIGEDGTIYAGYRDATTGQPTLMKVPANSTTPEIYAASEPQGVGDVLCGVAADGVATLVWMSGDDGLRAATLETGGALTPLANRLELDSPEGEVTLTLEVARSGSAIVQINTQIGSPVFVSFDDVVRLERAGWVGFPQRYGNTQPNATEPRTHFNAASGEWWVVRGGGTLGTLERLRSRPGEGLGEPALIYQSPLAGQIISWIDYGFDEYGRALLTLTEFYPGAQQLVILLE